LGQTSQDFQSSLADDRLYRYQSKRRRAEHHEEAKEIKKNRLPALYFNLFERTIFLSERKKEKNKAITHLQSHPIYQVSPFMQTSTKAILQPSQDIAMLLLPFG